VPSPWEHPWIVYRLSGSHCSAERSPFFTTVHLHLSHTSQIVTQPDAGSFRRETIQGSPQVSNQITAHRLQGQSNNPTGLFEQLERPEICWHSNIALPRSLAPTHPSPGHYKENGKIKQVSRIPYLTKPAWFPNDVGSRANLRTTLVIPSLVTVLCVVGSNHL